MAVFFPISETHWAGDSVACFPPPLPSVFTFPKVFSSEKKCRRLGLLALLFEAFFSPCAVFPPPPFCLPCQFVGWSFFWGVTFTHSRITTFFTMRLLWTSLNNPFFPRKDRRTIRVLNEEGFPFLLPGVCLSPFFAPGQASKRFSPAE